MSLDDNAVEIYFCNILFKCLVCAICTFVLICLSLVENCYLFSGLIILLGLIPTSHSTKKVKRRKTSKPRFTFSFNEDNNLSDISSIDNVDQQISDSAGKKVL